MTTFFVAFGIVGALLLGLILKLRSMPQYKISKEETHTGEERWFVKVRRGLSYYYLEQTKDLPGYADDVFDTSKHQIGAQETEVLAERVIVNHRMTTVNGIERESA